MDPKKYNIRSTLIYIEKNPGCDTNPDFINGNLVHDLYERGLVDGSKATHFQSIEQEYLNLRLTLDGKEYLDSLSLDAEQLSPWHQRPAGIVVLATIAGIIVAFVVYSLGWY